MAVAYEKIVESTKKYLLFNRVFSLNQSQSKNLIVGTVFLINEGVALPVLKMINQSWAGITFTEEKWLQFTESFPAIREYFDKKKTSKLNDLQIDGMYFFSLNGFTFGCKIHKNTFFCFIQFIF